MILPDHTSLSNMIDDFERGAEEFRLWGLSLKRDFEAGNKIDKTKYHKLLMYEIERRNQMLMLIKTRRDAYW